MPTATLKPPLHDTAMATKWLEPVFAWFLRIWQLLCSFAVLTKRRPPLPQSASHPELEKGLFTFGAHGVSRQGPAVKQRGGGDSSQDESMRPINIMDFQFTFENKPGVVSGDTSQSVGSLDSSGGTRAKPKPARRRKGSRESMERRRQRRAGRVPDFVPPPEIHIEDWSDNTMTSATSQHLLPFWQFPEFRPANGPVPSVIVTPSTPSEENTSALESFRLTFSLPPATKQSPPPVPSLPETQCDQIAQVLVSDGSDESTPSLEGYSTSYGPRSSFSFTDSLLEAAFGQLTSEFEDATPLDLLSNSATASGANFDQHRSTVVATPPSDWTDDSFHPSSNSTLRLGTPQLEPSQADSTQPSMLDDICTLAKEAKEPENTSAESTLSKRNIPYPDIFDLDMYADLRASMAAFGIYSTPDDRRGMDMPPFSSALPAPHSPSSPDTRPATITTFSFVTVPDASESGSGVPASAPAGEMPPRGTGRSTGVYAISGEFRFPSSQPPSIPGSPDSSDVTLAGVRHHLTNSSKHRVENDASIRPSTSRERRNFYLSGGNVPIGTDMQRYRDHHRHSAYSRSPPLHKRSSSATPDPRSSQGSKRDSSSSPSPASPHPRRLSEPGSARPVQVLPVRTRHSSNPGPGATEGVVQVSPRRTSVFRIPIPRVPRTVLGDRSNGQEPPTELSPAVPASVAAKGKRKSSSSLSSLVGKRSKRKAQSLWKGSTELVGVAGSQMAGLKKSASSISIVGRLSRKGTSGSTRTDRSSGASAKEEPAGGRTQNLLKQLHRLQERRKVGVLEERDENIRPSSRIGATTPTNRNRAPLTPGKNLDTLLKQRMGGDRIVIGRKRLGAKL